MQDADRQLFDVKWPAVQRSVSYLCSRRVELSAADRDDVLGHAGLILWRTILRGVTPINCTWIARAALSSWRASNKRHTAESLDERLDGVHATPEPHVDGVTVVDARLDSPELVELWETGISMSEAARRLGVSRQYVHQQADRLRGVAFGQPGRERPVWRFPRDTGLVSQSTVGVGIVDSGNARTFPYPDRTHPSCRAGRRRNRPAIPGRTC